MIVKTMNQVEIAREILADFSSVQKKVMTLKKPMRRSLIKSRKKYAFKIIEYESQRKNNWVIFIDCFKKETLTKYIVSYLDKNGFNAVMVLDNRNLMHISSHFIQRYNERYLQQLGLSKIEVLKQFIKRNPVGFLQKLPDDENHKNKFFGRLADGITLGYHESLPFTQISYHKTFINTKMVMEFQKNPFETSSQELSAYWDINFKFTKWDVFNSNPA